MVPVLGNGKYEVVWPRGQTVAGVIPCAERLDTLEGKTICELSNQIFRANEIFPILEKELAKLYPGIKFVSYDVFDVPHGKETGKKTEIVMALPDVLKQLKCDAVISGVVGGGSSAPATVRVSIAAEEQGFPSASIICDGFVTLSHFTAAGSGMPNLPISAYPGHVDTHSAEELQKNVETVLVSQVIKSLTVQPEEARPHREPASGDIVFKGTFEEVNRFFYEREWSDGLPIVPPTTEKVEEFLKYTDRSPDDVIGILPPDKREATVWNIAVNGVMAGCRPEYMPVLVALVEAMAEPKFGQEYFGHAPGTEVFITLNGTIIKELGFNYEQGALRVGFQANTSVGRFWRLYLRNVAGFLPRKTDVTPFGGTWRVVLAENEAAVAKIGWEPMSVDQGFKAGDNIVTITSCTSTDSVFSFSTAKTEEVLDRIAARIVDIQLFLFKSSFLGPGVRPQIILAPSIAEKIAKGGYSKSKVKQYLCEHAVFTARRYEQLSSNTFDIGSLFDAGKKGKLPEQYCQSEDPDRLLPIVFSPDDFLITVSGDFGKDNCFICAQNGFIGYPVSKKIELPARWENLLKEAKTG
ncbi:hypothetical protein ACFLUZ_01360 [Chloroflexota bacterium]